MTYDEVLKEAHAIKDALSAKHGYSVRRTLRALQRQQRQHPQRIVSFAKPPAAAAGRRATSRRVKPGKGRAA